MNEAAGWVVLASVTLGLAWPTTWKGWGIRPWPYLGYLAAGTVAAALFFLAFTVSMMGL